MTASIPFLDLGRLHASIKPELDAAIERVIADSSFVGGAEVEAFEEEFARAHNLEFAAGCGSGTDALALTLRALGIGPGDEVIVPAMTFVATAEAVMHTGARPIVADVDPVTLLLTPEEVDKVKTPRTRAVIPVHLYGHVVPFDAFDYWRDAGLLVIEDAAQAHIAQWNGEFVGSRSDAVCFSFFPSKNLGALGDGGLVLSTDANVVSHVKKLRDHGRVSKFDHELPGWCSRLDGLQAAVLRAKLTHLSDWTQRRRSIADTYGERLGELLVPWGHGAVHHLVVGRFTEPDKTQAGLKRRGVGTGRHYPSHLGALRWLSAGRRDYPAAHRASQEVLSLPIDPLMTSAEVAEVCGALASAVES